MKKLVGCFVLLFLFSCSSSETIEDTSSDDDFVDTYINTLETSVESARDAADTMNMKQQELQKSIEGLK